ncbi:Signal transduction histidine kinase [Nonomuraea maritima]|uniref:histidine kinase n=1 Tax=Nonomuraea maritima TaxID=683260 RepID=A0A1G9JM82_9ACTN|nr:PAS domain-containing sensor histidine kinase [Nonomuraea maritima]SDL38412.1 Signal transduction histidine kinase [Nonomuraea maritima]
MMHINHAALLTAVSAPCLVMTMDMIIVAVNQAYLDLCGHRREEVLGRYASDLFPRDRVGSGEGPLVPARQVAAPQRYGGTAFRSLGVPVTNQAVVLFVPHAQDVQDVLRTPSPRTPAARGPGTRDETRTAMDARPNARDETRTAMEARLSARAAMIRRLKEQLRAADSQAVRLLDRQRQFATDASHELRTPLAALRVEVEEAQLHSDDVDLPRLLHHVTDGIDRLESIIDDLLLLATIESGADRTQDDLDLTSVVASVAARLPDSLDVRLDLEPAVTVAAAFPQLTRLIANLLDNARRHAAHRLTISLRRSDGQAVLTVDDDGEGISPADRERVFQRFVRLDSARSRDRGGAGLGLAIARDIAEAHQGSLHVEDAAGGGARFVLRLPLIH